MRYRLNRGGDRRLNRALTTIVIVRMRTSISWDQGWEMSLHEQITAKTGVRIHFPTPLAVPARYQMRKNARICGGTIGASQMDTA